MQRRSFQHRAETLGFDTPLPWSLHALRLLFSVPRAYSPLVDAWDSRFPGAKAALTRLVELNFAAHQPEVIVDTRSGQVSQTSGRPVPRYRATSRGKRLSRSAQVDSRVLKDTFPRITLAQEPRLAALIAAFDLAPPVSKNGVSVAYASMVSGLPSRSSRWWVERLTERGFLHRMPRDLPDVRPVVPAHWRVTRLLCRQLADVIDAFPATASPALKVEFRLSRTRFLGDIDPARVGLGGATDFDHDIETQQVLSALFASPRAATGGVFAVEPRLNLAVEQRKVPWQFVNSGTGSVFYQPDAEMRETPEGGGPPTRSVVEYERFQTRRDGWSHIERFLGWVHLTSLPFEPAVLRFVVDSESRVRSYVELIEAFADYCMDFPDRVPSNTVTLAVTSAERIAAAQDPLDPRTWYRINLPAGGSSDTARVPVLHKSEDSPYDEYFSRG